MEAICLFCFSVVEISGGAENVWNWKDIGLFCVDFEVVNDLLMFKVANLDFEWLYKIVELRMGIWVVTYEYERGVIVW